jgi:hypothetical protein
VLWRVLEAASAPGSLRIAGGAAALALPALIGIWAVSGPLAHGWARRAGTPTSLLASPVGSVSVTKVVTVGATGSLPSAPFDASLNGRFSESGAGSDGLVTVGMNASADSGAKGVLQVTLRGVPLQEGGIQMTGSSVDFGPRGAPQTYSGQIVSLEGSHLVASVHDSSGSALGLEIVLNLDPSSRTLSGSLHVT